MSLEDTVLRTDYLQVCNELGHCKAEVKTAKEQRDFNYKQWQEEKELNTKLNDSLVKLTQDYNTLDEKRESYEQAISDASETIAKLTDERREIAETVSRLELQVRDLRDSLTANLDNQHRDGLKYDKLVKANEQLQKDNKTLTAISLDSLISINQLISKQQ